MEIVGAPETSREQAIEVVDRYTSQIGTIPRDAAEFWWRSETLDGVKAAFDLPDDAHKGMGAEALGRVSQFLTDLEALILIPYEQYRRLPELKKVWIDVLLRCYDLMRMDMNVNVGPGYYAFTSFGLAAALYGNHNEISGQNSYIPPGGSENDILEAMKNRKAAAYFISCWREALERGVNCD
ncbi:MAG: hypothetical protein KOO63_05675 [Bacteroidales bacterium]|nr:hypothetical protein [Candidatus Latescibacterota bacterium]